MSGMLFSVVASPTSVPGLFSTASNFLFLSVLSSSSFLDAMKSEILNDVSRF
ncbi:hypothetical protein HanPSC8_Chr10g0439671 [Helianthus annuus]|nr:hypothetical protein HanPSC8_Chr10g0439671 [Helianthus annuus]